MGNYRSWDSRLMLIARTVLFDRTLEHPELKK
jgi:hypothetical protein